MIRSTTGFDRRRQKTRQAILAAAIDLFQSKGVQVTSVEQICDRAEVSVRTFFNHFESRQDLHDTITQERAKETASIFRLLADDPRSFSLGIEQVLTGIADYLAERPALRDFVGEMLQQHPARRDAGGSGGLMAEGALAFVTKAIEREEISPDLSPNAVADVIAGSIMKLTANWCASEDFDVRAAARETAKVLSRLCAPH